MGAEESFCKNTRPILQLPIVAAIDATPKSHVSGLASRHDVDESHRCRPPTAYRVHKMAWLAPGAEVSGTAWANCAPYRRVFNADWAERA
jgi:hypothetical protein